MEYEIIYHTRTIIVFFEISLFGVKATIYNKDVPVDADWITVATDTLEADTKSTDFQLCRALLKNMRKEYNI